MIALFLSMLVTGADPVQRQDLQDYFCKDTNKPFFELREGLLRPGQGFRGR